MQPTEPGSYILENGTLRPNEKDEAMAERMRNADFGLRNEIQNKQADGAASAEGEAK